jgi:peptidoglycan/LPS O-acetylase OafA/YrhL
LAIPFLNHYWFGGKKVVLGSYLLRRLTRLEPPYILAMIMFFGVHVIVLHVPFADYLPNFFASLVHCHNFIFGRSSVILPVAWSLEVEVQFYLLVPLLALLLFKPKKHIVGFVLVSALLLATIFTKNYIMSHQLKTIGSSILVYFSHFAVGILFSMVYLSKPQFIAKKSFLWDVLGLLGVFSLFYFYKPQVAIVNNIFFNAAIFTLFLAVFKGRITNRIYTQPFLFVVGSMCYSIYLIHFPLLLLFTKATKHLAFFEGYYANYLLQFVILIPLVLSISAVYFKLFEQPFMDKNWPQKFKAAWQQRFNKPS